MGWVGVAEFEAALRKVAAEADLASKKALAQAAADAEAKIKANFEGSHKKGEPHVGGDKPNIVTGALRRSVHADPIRRFGLSDYGTKIGPRMIYGRRVELGYHGSKGYPYFGPGVADSRDNFGRFGREAWTEFIR